SRGARGPAEQEAEVAPGDVGERRGRAREEREAQVIGVEGDGFVDVVDHVPDVDGAHGLSFRRETETRKSISRYDITRGARRPIHGGCVVPAPVLVVPEALRCRRAVSGRPPSSCASARGLRPPSGAAWGTACRG